MNEAYNGAIIHTSSFAPDVHVMIEHMSIVVKAFNEYKKNMRKFVFEEEK